MPHTSHKESGIADTQDYSLAVNFGFSDTDRLFQMGLRLDLSDLLFVSGIVQRIGIGKAGTPLGEAPLIRHQLNPCLSFDTKIAAAFRTDIIMINYVLFI